MKISAYETDPAEIRSCRAMYTDAKPRPVITPTAIRLTSSLFLSVTGHISRSGAGKAGTSAPGTSVEPTVQGTISAS